MRNASETILHTWRSLKRQWETTSSLWNDAVKHRFQKTYMDEYEPVVSSVLKELDNLQEIIAQARRHVK